MKFRFTWSDKRSAQSNLWFWLPRVTKQCPGMVSLRGPSCCLFFLDTLAPTAEGAWPLPLQRQGTKPMNELPWNRRGKKARRSFTKHDTREKWDKRAHLSGELAPCCPQVWPRALKRRGGRRAASWCRRWPRRTRWLPCRPASWGAPSWLGLPGPRRWPGGAGASFGWTDRCSWGWWLSGCGWGCSGRKVWGPGARKSGACGPVLAAEPPLRAPGAAVCGGEEICGGPHCRSKGRRACWLGRRRVLKAPSGKNLGRRQPLPRVEGMMPSVRLQAGGGGKMELEVKIVEGGSHHLQERWGNDWERASNPLFCPRSALSIWGKTIYSHENILKKKRHYNIIIIIKLPNNSY